eukprot:CAMPEP_0184316552 /NCGR_PEP_ID=MMETSP1049-20130417/90855_1 /TAXON_ID=77928 /ORGANISM="Proteomonas sulcata, Strain CCMP704" /LENGTH=329 /DNA_ID=CAMNT_0026635569 /DNA_START=168 /DNA_END=1155 /DNA_ORIENTATION=+
MGHLDLKPSVSASELEKLRQDVDQELQCLMKMQEARNRGNVAFQDRRFAEAVSTYSSAMDLIPTHKEYMATLYRNRAAAHMSMGRPQKAWEDCTNSLRFKPFDNLAALMRRARAAQALSKFADAVADLEASQKLVAASTPDQTKSVDRQGIAKELDYCRAQAAKQEEHIGKERMRQEKFEGEQGDKDPYRGRSSAWWHWENGKGFEKVDPHGTFPGEPPHAWARHQQRPSGPGYRRASSMPRFSGFGFNHARRQSDSPDYYKVLGVTSKATESEIKKAFHKLALQYHPDKVSEDEVRAAEEKFKLINTAYKILSDPAERRRYDLSFDTD